MRIMKLASVIGLVVLALHVSPARAATPPAPDPSYQTNGRVYSITFSRGVMYIGGAFTSVRPPGAPPGWGEVGRNHVAALDAETGSLLPWDPDVDGTVRSILVHRSTVYLGGNFSRVGGAERSNVAAVTGASLSDATNTATVLEWNPGADERVFVIRKGPNGNLFIGGRFGTIGGLPVGRIAQVTTDGAVVPDWAPRVEQVNDEAPCPPRCPPKVFTIAFGPSADAFGNPVTAVFLGGHFGLVNGVSREQAAAVDIEDSSNLLPFNPNIYAEPICPICRTVETHRVYRLFMRESKVYMCGGFWTTHASPGGGRLRAFNVLVTDPIRGWADPTYAAGNDGDTPDCAIRDGVLYMGGHFSWVGAACSQNPPPGTGVRKCGPTNSTHRLHVAAVDATTGEVLDWDPAENSAHGVWSIARDRERVAFGGDFTRFGGVDQQGIAVYSTNLPESEDG